MTKAAHPGDIDPIDPINSTANNKEMNFVLAMGQQPLFRLLSAIIVLLITDMNPMYGVVAGIIWLVWIYVSRPAFFSGTQ